MNSTSPEAVAPILGFFLQYLRAYKWYTDLYYVLTLLVLTGLGTWLTNGDWSADRREFAGELLFRAWTMGNLIGGGTMGAKLLSKQWSGVPGTNSK